MRGLIENEIFLTIFFKFSKNPQLDEIEAIRLEKNFLAERNILIFSLI